MEVKALLKCIILMDYVVIMHFALIVDYCSIDVLHYVEFCAYVTELDYLDYHKT